MSSVRVGVRALALILSLVAFAPAANASASALFDLDAPGPLAADQDEGTVEGGSRFTVTSSFRADGIAVYRAPGNPIVSMRAHLWDGDRLVATALTRPTPASGWVHASFFDGPHKLTPGTEYVASYTAEGGHYPDTTGFFEDPLA